MRRAWLALIVPLLFAPRAAWPQGGDPLGTEFRVNSYTTGQQRYPSIASDAAGNFVVVWAGPVPPSGFSFGIRGQRYSDSGAPLGPEFAVSTYTTTLQAAGSVASDASGNFVAVWTSQAQDGSGYGVFGQRYASSGTPLGSEFRVNTYTTNNQTFTSVAADPVGNFVVAWQSYVEDGSGFGIFGQRYASSGAPLGSEFRVNSYTSGQQLLPSVAADSSGNFVVVWPSAEQDGWGYGVFAQRFASSGTPLGPEFRVNTHTIADQRFPAVAADLSGNFVVVWESYDQDGAGGFGVFGQRYASSGTPLGPEFRVNSFTTSSQRFPAVATDSSGNFVVVWSSYFQDGSMFGVFGQRYASSGTALGPEFRVNAYTTFSQLQPSVAADTDGSFVIAWQSETQDGSYNGVFGQRYGRIVPVELMGYGVE